MSIYLLFKLNLLLLQQQSQIKKQSIAFNSIRSNMVSSRKKFFKILIVLFTTLFIICIAQSNQQIQATQTDEVAEAEELTVYSCQDATQEERCKQQKGSPICTISQQSHYMTFVSACEACKFKQDLKYTLGKCTCPRLPCEQNQVCANGDCIFETQIKRAQFIEEMKKFIDTANYQQAIDKIELKIQEGESDSYYYYLQSVGAFAAQNHKESLKYIKKALDLQPHNSGYYVIRGRAFLHNNKSELAMKQFKKASDLGFQDKGTLAFYQAEGLVLSDKNEMAIKKFEEALKHYPKKVEWYIKKAIAHAINHEYKMAILTVKQGLKIDPDNESLKEHLKNYEQNYKGEQKYIEQAKENNEKLKQTIYKQRKLKEQQQKEMKNSNPNKGEDDL